MEKLYAANISNSNLNENLQRMSPRKSAINFIRHFARSYAFANIGNNELGSLIIN